MSDSSHSPHSEPHPAQRSETALMQSRRALHLVISSLPHLLLQVSTKDAIIAFFVPPGFPAILNAQSLETGQSLKVILPETFLAPIEDALYQARETGKVITLEQECPLEGEARYFEIKVAP